MLQTCTRTSIMLQTGIRTCYKRAYADVSCCKRAYAHVFADLHTRYRCIILGHMCLKNADGAECAETKGGGVGGRTAKTVRSVNLQFRHQ